MSQYKDQYGNIIELSSVPQRIISLVPSQTELLYDLGLDEAVTGITKFCVHPDHWFRNKTRIGGTKNINIEKIKLLQPDLIIANKEENVREQIEALKEVAPVWVSDVNNLDDALSIILSIGEITNKHLKAKLIVQKIKEQFSYLSSIRHHLSTAYLIWKDPYMTVGGDTFIHDMMQSAGFVNVFAELKRYPEITIGHLADSGCEVILLSSEPYPFKEKHIETLQHLLPGRKIILADGEMFSWYGSRLQNAPRYFMDLMEKINQ